MRLGFFFRHCATRGVVIYAANALFCVANTYFAALAALICVIDAQNTTPEVYFYTPGV